MKRYFAQDNGNNDAFNVGFCYYFRLSRPFYGYENSIMAVYDHRYTAPPETAIRELAFRTIFQIVSALDGHPIIPGIVIIARSRYPIVHK